MAIYIDVLLIINFYVTYFLILATSGFLHIKLTNGRKISGSAVGCFTSFTIFLPQLDVWVSMGIKLVFCCLIVAITFRLQSKKMFLRNLFFFVVINFVFAGAMLGLWLFVSPMNMIYNNGVVYFDISFFTIVISTIAAYFLIKLIRFFLDSGNSLDMKYKITITNNSHKKQIDAIADSGNSLVDFFSGLPVIICRHSFCTDILPQNLRELIEENDLSKLDFVNLDAERLKGLKILPITTVGGSGIVLAFSPEKIVVNWENGSKEVSALIGISTCQEQNYAAIFNPKILL